MQKEFLVRNGREMSCYDARKAKRFFPRFPIFILFSNLCYITHSQLRACMCSEQCTKERWNVGSEDEMNLRAGNWKMQIREFRKRSERRENENCNVVKLCWSNSIFFSLRKNCFKICLTSSPFMRDNLCPSLRMKREASSTFQPENTATG